MTEIDAHLAASLSRRFRLVRRLGQGGMGAVFLAEQIAVGNRPVALKVLSRKLLDDPNFLLRFKNEAASTGRIHHPNVVTIYESGQADDGTPYIAMEFLEGESLRQALTRRGALPVPGVAEILQQAARGLNAAHKLGIIHRDLKPDNIFLTYPEDESVALASPPAQVEGALAPTSPSASFVVKIVDFGIAKLRESGTHTQTGMVLGTPAYMSFEQASGMRSDELDARSDVYSLGVVVYEMLTGRTPFHSDTPVGYLRMHMQEYPPPFRAVKPGLPALPQLESVVMKALSKDRDQRYGSVLEFARELAQATLPPVPKTIVPTAVRDTVPAKPVPARPESSRRKWPVVAGCFVFLLVAAVGGFWYRTRFGWKPAQGQVVSTPAITFSPFALERTLSGHRDAVDSVAFSPDGRLLASGGEDRTVKLWDVASGSLRRTLTDSTERVTWVTSVAFSPDGKFLASGSTGKTVKLWDVASGALRRTLTDPAGVHSVAFSPDGKLLASGSDDKTVKLWDMVSGALRQTLTGDSKGVESVAFSPDGKILASGSNDHTVKLWDVVSGALRQTLSDHHELVDSVAFSPDGKVLASASWDHTIKLWDVVSGALMRTLTDSAEVVSVAFSPDGKLLVSSGSMGKTVKLWDATSGTLRQTLTGHSEGVNSVAFSPDGELLASGSTDETIKLWRRRENTTGSTGPDTGVEAKLAQMARTPGEVRENAKDGLKYVWIPPGTFMMGCSPGDNECGAEEKPAHQVTITKGFWLGQTPVTVGAYKRFATATGRQMPDVPWPNDAMPVVNVDWDDATAYCGWAGGRLPTEAEWEYAARAGNTEARYGPIDEVAWYGANSGVQTHEVAQKRANGFGLYDMLGNVWEWVDDWFDYYQNGPAQDPTGPASGQERVLRGGCWGYGPRDVRVSKRFWGYPAFRFNIFGVRCAREVNIP